MRITREQAVILLSCAVAVSSVFMTMSLRNQVTAYQNQVELLQSRNDNYSLKINELEKQPSTRAALLSSRTKSTLMRIS